MIPTRVESMTTGGPALSIVIPVYNEQGAIDDLMTAIEAAMGSFVGGYEIVFVDDGSTDDTLERLKRHAAASSRVRVFSFRRNLGKSPALTCGFQKAAGRYIATMDADLQDDPADIPRIYAHMKREQVSVVSGWRKDRRDSWLKIVSSRMFNLIVVRKIERASCRERV